MEEPYLFTSSLALLAMGCLAFAMFMIFRLKSRTINGLPKNLSADIFHKTFIVFNPYPEHSKIIHSFLSMLPLFVLFASLGFVLIMWKILESGLLLSLFMLLVGLNMIAVEYAPEVYQNSKIFVKAVQGGTSLGVGDIKVFQIMKNLMPKLSNYYLGLSILFIASSVLLPYVWSSVLWFFSFFMGLILQVSSLTGIIGWQVAVALFALTLVVFQIFVSLVKDRILSHTIEFSV